MEKEIDEDQPRPSAKDLRSSRRTLVALLLVTGISLAGVIIGFFQRLMAS